MCKVLGVAFRWSSIVAVFSFGQDLLHLFYILNAAKNATRVKKLIN